MATEFEELERGVESSEPIHLVRVDVGGTTMFMTSDAVDVEYQGNIYKNANLSIEGFSDGSDPNKAQIRVHVGMDSEVAQFLLGGGITDIIYLTAFRKQRQWPAAEMFWSGEVLGQAANQEGIYLNSADDTQSQKMNGNAIRWQKTCPAGIYDPWFCGASKSFRRVDIASVTRVGATFSSPALLPASLIAAGKMVTGHEENWFVGGFVEYQDQITNLTVKKTITAYNHLTGVIYLHPNMLNYGGEVVSVFPGCKRNTEDCDVKHQNLRLNKSCPFLPTKDLFDPSEQLPW